MSIIELLSSSEDLVFRYADMVLERDEELGLDLLKKKFRDEDAVKQDQVLNHLQKFPKAHLAYQEFLVLERNSLVNHAF